MKSKFMPIFIALCLIITTVSANAFGGYAHWEIARRVAENKNMLDTVANYYKSGCLFADIGKVSWDNKYTVSDSKIFAETMLAEARRTKVSAWVNFASGWYDHYIQDTKGSVANISGGPSLYRVKCGWIDEYLRDDLKIESPMDGTDVAYVNYYLIRETYRQLDNFSPTDSQIDDEIEKMYAAYDLAILLNVSGWSDAEKKSIEKALNRTASLCNGILPMNPGKSNISSNLQAGRLQEKYISFDEVCNMIRNDKYLKLQLDAANKFTKLDKKMISKDVYELKRVITDKESYYNNLEIIAKNIREMD